VTSRRPLTPARPGPFRLLLIVFVVRHIIGIALFAYLIRMAVLAGGSFYVTLLVLAAAYAGYAAFGAWRIYGQYQRTRIAEDRRQENSRVAR
jgi:Kef-type K+ transport system membrane component KefB